MPLSKLHVPVGMPAELCRAAGEALHLSLVDTCGVNPDDNFCLIARYATEDMIVHPTFLGERDPAVTVVIEITLLAGRSEAQKEALHVDVRERLAVLGIEPANVILFLVENGPADWSFSDAGSVKTVLGL
ncbi:tautomerase family protein [Pontivivens ytuae]|uniref:Tautomerase family protein n=1 Tax=Pontivivens ytuae TaxID=2789856 RepID=A0A7S9QDH8_9RHOB|nr:tautomerase family protein [Pontivivens ytuae]QPH54905.1 tautomerase family protein [Pontivivens ytuae]